MKKIVRLTESDLVKLVKKVIQENEMTSERQTTNKRPTIEWLEIV